MKTKYTEPSEYIPKEIRKKLKLGEFAEDKEEKKPENERELNKAFRDYVNGKK